MTAVPVTRTFVAGEVVLASHFNTNIRDVLNFLLNPPIFQGRQTSSQTFTTGVEAAVTLDVEDVDSAGGHSTVTNTSRYTAVYPGWYWPGSGTSYVANATGGRNAAYKVNGTNVNAGGVTVPGQATLSTRVPGRGMLVFLNVGDYIELWGYQSSGGNLGSSVTGIDQPGLTVKWVSN